MKYFSFLLIAVLLFSFACLKDEPVIPTETDENWIVKFDRYDKENRFLGTATAYYCATNAQFAVAEANCMSGDIIYLVNDDTLFAADSLGDGKAWDDIDIIGVDSLRSKLDPAFPANEFDINNSDLTNVHIWGGNIWLSDVCNLNDIKVGASGCVIYGYSINYPCTSIVLNSDALRLQVSNSNIIDVYNSDFFNASETCDYNIEVGPDYVNVHTWIYDDTTYSYDDQNVTATGAWWDKENNLVTFTACSSEYGSEAVLYYNLDGGCGASFSTTNAADDNGYDDCSTGTYHWAQVSVTGSTQRVYYKWKSTLCDSVVWTSCAMKGKPRTSDSGIPPDPFQE